jgi:hypothetical protein
MAPYCNEDCGDVNTSKKTYHEHLSYIMHLCKKKEGVYESMVTEFKDKMKESDLRTSVLEKKLSALIEERRQLRELVYRESDPNTINQTILKFSY